MNDDKIPAPADLLEGAKLGQFVKTFRKRFGLITQGKGNKGAPDWRRKAWRLGMSRAGRTHAEYKYKRPDDR